MVIEDIIGAVWTNFEAENGSGMLARSRGSPEWRASVSYIDLDVDGWTTLSE